MLVRRLGRSEKEVHRQTVMENAAKVEDLIMRNCWHNGSEPRSNVSVQEPEPGVISGCATRTYFHRDHNTCQRSVQQPTRTGK